jgi:hypothetical protein
LPDLVRLQCFKCSFGTFQSSDSNITIMCIFLQNIRQKMAWARKRHLVACWSAGGGTTGAAD